MKKLVMHAFLVLMSGIIPISFAVAANQIFTTPNVPYQITELEKALNTIIDSDSGGKNQHIVIFVHGRAGGKVKHPEKAITQMLPFIESEYNTRVVLFNWEGSGVGGPTGFPQDEARAAADDFFKILTQLAKYRQDNIGGLTGVTFSILTHSMGSIVVEETIIKHSAEIQLGVADVLVLSSAASKAKKHPEWLDNAHLADQVFVTLNDNDKSLGKAGILRGRRLGKGLKGTPKTSENAQYIDLSKTGVKHRYFIARTAKGGIAGQKSNPCIAEFYSAALIGDPVHLDTFPGIQAVTDERISVMKKASGSICQ